MRVPVENRIGEEGQGWTYAKVLLTHERTGQAFVGSTRKILSDLRELASRDDLNRAPLLAELGFQAQLVAAELKLEALATTELRTLSTIATGGAPGPESSILKIKGTELAQEATALWLEAGAYYSLPITLDSTDPTLSRADPVGPQALVNRTAEYLNQRKVTIYGGSNEIQRNIIAKSILRL